jgi:hypothetical protein
MLPRTKAFWIMSNNQRRRTLTYATQYTIEEPGVDLDVLKETVTKHCGNLSRYLLKRPIAAHTQEAFSILQEQLATRDDPIILDR